MDLKDFNELLELNTNWQKENSTVLASKIGISVEEVKELRKKRRSLVLANQGIDVPEEIEGFAISSFSQNSEGKRSVVWRKRIANQFEFTDEVKDFIKEALIDVSPFTFVVNGNPSPKNKAQIFWVADTHVGMCNPNPLYGKTYSLTEFTARLLSIPQYVQECDELIICFLGDGIDGLDGMTISRKHPLPQDLNNFEQIIGFVEAFKQLFTVLMRLKVEGVVNKIRFVSVDQSNHSGYMDKVCAHFISEWLSVKFPEIKTQIAKNYIDHFEAQGHTFVYCHGKDMNYQKHGFPAQINSATSLYFLQYLAQNGIEANDEAHVVSADLHMETYSESSFSYQKVLPLAIGSDWVQTNFGKGKSGVSYSKILSNGSIERGAIKFK